MTATSRDQPAPASPAWSATDLAVDPHLRDDKASRVERMFSAIASSYDFNNRLHSLGQDQRWRRVAVALSGAGPGDRVLDVACGTGDLSEAFVAAGVESVIGADFTQAMLDLAARKAARLPEARRPSYRWADATRLPFESSSFDVVSIAFGIRNVSSPEKALAEFRRVLRPGGRLVVLEFSRPANPVIRAMNDFYCRRVMPLTATLLSGDRSGAYRYLPRSVETFPDHHQLAARIREAGFEIRAQRPLTFGVCAVTVGVVGAVGAESGRNAAATPR